MRRSYLPIEELPNWAQHYAIQLNGCTITRTPSGRGCGVVATEGTTQNRHPFIIVPSDMILNYERVWKLAETDPHLKELLEANGAFAKTFHGAIRIFLLMQVAHSSPDMVATIGTDSAFSEYIKFISDERSLPTFWTEAERQCLWGTSLERHHKAKFFRLKLEFQEFCEASKDVSWAAQWWGENGCLAWDDWKLVDAMHRSRAMDLDIHGSCLVPVMDMANHALEGKSVAYYTDKGFVNEARLSLEGPAVGPPEGVEEGQEITINYGESKGASETIHSYGFFDEEARDSHVLMLYWQVPTDDDLARYKMDALKLAPLIKIFRPTRANDCPTFWDSPCVWAMSVNQEDGLEIQYTGSTDDKPNFRVLFKDKVGGEETVCGRGVDLVNALQNARYRKIFEARALTYVRTRVVEEVSRREALGARDTSQKIPQGIDPRTSRVWMVSERLRALEMELLVAACQDIEQRLDAMLYSSDFQKYSQGILLQPLTEAEIWVEEEYESRQEKYKNYINELTLVAAASDKDLWDTEQWGTDEDWEDEYSDDVFDSAPGPEDESDSGIEDCWEEMDQIKRDKDNIAVLCELPFLEALDSGR